MLRFQHRLWYALLVAYEINWTYVFSWNHSTLFTLCFTLLIMYVRRMLCMLECANKSVICTYLSHYSNTQWSQKILFLVCTNYYWLCLGSVGGTEVQYPCEAFTISCMDSLGTSIVCNNINIYSLLNFSFWRQTSGNVFFFCFSLLCLFLSLMDSCITRFFPYPLLPLRVLKWPVLKLSSLMSFIPSQCANQMAN